MTFLKLGDVLDQADSLSSSDHLYLPFDEAWTLETRAGLDPSTGLDGMPEAALEAELEPAIGMDAVQDVVINARDQLGTPAPDQLLAAFLFYYDNDAFIEF